MPKNVTTGSFVEASAKLKESLEASNRQFATDLANLRDGIESNRAKFKATWNSLSAEEPKVTAKPNSSGKSIMSRKVWDWLYPN